MSDTTVAHFNRVLKKAEGRAWQLEPKLSAVIEAQLIEAGNRAADNFERMATNHLTASLVSEDAWCLASTPDPRALIRSLALRAAGDVKPTSTMIAIKPRPEEADEITIDGGHAADTLHVTLAYLGDYEGDLQILADALAEVAASHAPLEGKIGGRGVFEGSETEAPSILMPSVPGLVELRVDVTEALVTASQEYGRDHGYQPHITVAYAGDDGLDASRDLLGLPLHFDSLWVVRGDTDTIEIPLTGKRPLTAALVFELTGDDMIPIPGADGWFVPRDAFESAVAMVTNARAEDLEAEVARVADEHNEGTQPDYGFTFWNPVEGKVFWIVADYTTNEQIEAGVDAFLAIEGVEECEACDECGAPEGEDWVKVWPSNLVAAATPDWTSPARDEILDVDSLVASLRTKTDPIRQAVIETTARPALDDVGIEYDVTNPFTRKALAQSGSQITEISKTTQFNVMRIIRTSYDQGLSIPDTATAIRVGMTEAAPARATLIARTELAGAVNGGSLAATQIYDQSVPGGSGLMKSWLVSPGAKFPRHEEYDGLDGQTTTLDGYFDVGGFQLQFPGDPDGPPEEICQCRCTMIYEEGGQTVAEADAESGAPPDIPSADGEAPEGGAELADQVEALALSDVGAGGGAEAAADNALLEAATAEQPVAELTTGFFDDISVGDGPALPRDTVETIHRLKLNTDIEPGPAAKAVLGDAKDTDSLYRPGGPGTPWNDRRLDLHREIERSAFEGKVPTVEGEQPTAFFTSGGGASGKGSATFIDPAGKEWTLKELDASKDYVVIDPDRIKAQLPEYKIVRDAGDPSAAAIAHEESSQIAKDITAKALANGYNVVIDTTGSGSGFTAKLIQAADAGYDVQVTMFSIPTNEAIVRSIARAERVGGSSFGRYVRVDPLKDAHKNASVQLDKWKDLDAVKEWRVFDNSGGGAQLVAESTDGQITILDPQKWAEILAKGHE